MLEVGNLISATRLLRILLLAVIISVLFIAVDMAHLLIPATGTPAVVCGSGYVGGKGGILYRMPLQEYVKPSSLATYAMQPELLVGMPSGVVTLKWDVERILSGKTVFLGDEYRKVVGLDSALEIAKKLRQRGLRVVFHVDVTQVKSFRREGSRIKFDVERFTAMVGDKVDGYCVASHGEDLIETRNPLTFCGCPEGDKTPRWLTDEEVKRLLEERQRTGKTHVNVSRWYIVGRDLHQIEDVLKDVGLMIVSPSYYSIFSLYLLHSSIFGLILVLVMIVVYLSISEFLNTTDVTRNVRRLFVLYSLGRSNKWLAMQMTLTSVLDFAMSVLLAVVISVVTAPVLRRVYMPPKISAALYFRSLNFSAGKGMMLNVTPAWGWRLMAVLLLGLLLLALEYVWFYRNIKGSFFARGARIIPLNKMVISVVLLTVFVSGSLVWAAWAGIRLYDSYRVYRVPGFVVADSDLGMLHIKANLAVEVLKRKRIDSLLVLYTPTADKIYYCPIGAGGAQIWHRIEAPLKTLWGVKEVVRNCDSLDMKTDSFSVWLVYVDKSKIEQFAVGYARQLVEMFAQEGIGPGKGLDVNTTAERMLKEFTSMDSLIRLSLDKSGILAAIFMAFAVFSAFALGYALSEMIVVLLPYRIAVFMALGETVSGALQRVLRIAIVPVVVASVVSGLLVVVMLIVAWFRMYAKPPLFLNFVPAVVVLLIIVSVYIGILLTAAGVKREGVISIMKRDL